jgi:hypothetical protein
MTIHVGRGLNPVRRIAGEKPCTQGACTTTEQFVRGCARRNHPSLRVRAAKRAAAFPHVQLPAANAATQPSGTGGTLARFKSYIVLLGGPLPPPRRNLQCNVP